MKTRIGLVLVGLFLSLSVACAQKEFSDLVDAFKKSDARLLEKKMDDQVDLILLNHSVKSNRRKAVAMLDDFFAQNKVNDFEVIHEGKRRESGFFIGKLSTEQGAFRVNCFLKKIDEDYLIHQIRIEKTNE